MGNFTVLVVQTWDGWLHPLYVMTSSYVAHLHFETSRFISTYSAKTRVYSAFQAAVLWGALNTWYQPGTSEASHARWSLAIAGYCFQHCLLRDNPFGHTTTKPVTLSAFCRMLLTNILLPLHSTASSSTGKLHVLHPELVHSVYLSGQALETFLKLPMAPPTTQPQELSCCTEGCSN